MKIYRTKKGQPYIIQANGRARFIKKSKSSYSRKSKGGVKVAKKRSKRSSGGFGGLGGGVIGKAGGVVAYVLFERYIEPKITENLNVNPALINAAEILLGAYLAKKGGMFGETGKAAIYINLYQLAMQYLPA